MKDDLKILLWAAVGIGALAWGVNYSSQIGTLTQGLTGGYGNVVHALEPPSTGGSLSPSAISQSNAPYGSLNPN